MTAPLPEWVGTALIVGMGVASAWGMLRDRTIDRKRGQR